MPGGWFGFVDFNLVEFHGVGMYIGLVLDDDDDDNDDDDDYDDDNDCALKMDGRLTLFQICRTAPVRF